MIKELSKSVREFKKPAILTPLIVTLEVIMEVIIPLLMADLIDKGIYSGQMSEIVKMGITLILASILALTFGILSGITATKASSGFAKNLRQDLYYKVQKFSFILEFLERNRKASAWSHIDWNHRFRCHGLLCDPVSLRVILVVSI